MTFLSASTFLLAVHRPERIQVDQVERFGQIDDEAFAALADEDAAVGAQPGIVDVVDVVVGVLRVVSADRLVADAIDRLA